MRPKTATEVNVLQEIASMKAKILVGETDNVKILEELLRKISCIFDIMSPCINNKLCFTCDRFQEFIPIILEENLNG